MLHAMFSGRFDSKPAEDGSYFIDRDGTHFRYILNYLRTGYLLAPEDKLVRKELLEEAQFYQIRGIVDELRRFRDPKSCQRNKNKSLPAVVSKINWNAVIPSLCWFIELQEMAGIPLTSMVFATIKDQLLPWWGVEITFLEATQSSRGMVSITIT